MRNYGSEVKYHNDQIGVNDEQAAFLKCEITTLDFENEQAKDRKKVFGRN
jgi:hypothetical protein